MSDIVAVLVVPVANDPGGLLAEGVGRSRPPCFSRERTTPVCRECGAPGRWSPAPTDQTDSRWVCSVEWRHDGIDLVGWSGWMATSARRDGAEYALPLWWEGALAPEGWDRARRVFYAHGPSDCIAILKQGPGTHPPLSTVEQFAGWLVREAYVASRVIRLTRVDGRLVELEPEVTP